MENNVLYLNIINVGMETKEKHSSVVSFKIAPQMEYSVVWLRIPTLSYPTNL